MTGQGAYIFGCEGPRLTPAERDFFERTQPWGFILFARNVENPDQIRALTAELRGAVSRDVPIFIDQEGGRVARMTGPHWREWLPVLEQVMLNKRDALRTLYLRYRLIADELLALGIDGNCAPLADIANADTHPILRNRCYGEDVVRVAERAGNVAQALLDGGVLPVVKHMPGQGRATLDSHQELPRVATKAKELARTDFMAFEPLSGLPIGMTAHVVYDDIDADNPATQSTALIQVIRERIGFDGLLMTDDLSMQALSGPLSLRARRSVQAGCDMILHCNGALAEMDEIAEATGPLTGPALDRANAALTWRRRPDPIDIPALDAEFQSLMTGQGSEQATDERD
ncbi:glycoside hydrolase family 3 N-terminal domain-containing protein [Aliiroseovarius sediminis]|uniref:glycoside hydrolase family 3 N-terminal domain-containing protein n=1 Tax=Aliiroseovarius sediminis TaxID=2925839 RepID=UPI001F57B1A4|nr:glycoside hydrolase family 3 N-terminal domain-containing protein [Aliiroseovarius sediminis]MCI2393328.1 beta-hexosaminidase [Aliiroseovarius sediminis]